MVISANFASNCEIENETCPFLDIIRADFRKIHSTIPNLKIDEIVTLPGQPNTNISYQGLIRLKEKGVKTYYYPEADVEVNIEQLLGCQIYGY